MTSSKNLLRKKLLKDFKYPFKKCDLISDLKNKRKKSFQIAGRLYYDSERDFKAGRFFILDHDSKLSVCLDQSYPLESFNCAFYELLKEGDIISLHFHSSQLIKKTLRKMNQISLLSPCLKEPLIPFSFQKMHEWNLFLKAVSDYFIYHHFYEVNTPCITSCFGIDFSLDPFLIKGKKKNFLITSPELNLKRYLSLGLNRFFEITKCFRDKEDSKIHEREFHMIEWYRSYSGLDQIKKDIIGLISYLKKRGFVKIKIDQFETQTVRDLFLKHLSFKLKENTSQKELYELARKKGHKVSPKDSIHDLFQILWVSHIEEKLGKKALFIQDYPKYTSALNVQEKWAHRFEFYLNSYEIANAFLELNNPSKNKEIFNEMNQKRKKDKKQAISWSLDFEKTLSAGMPPASGIALGLERLFMALQGEKDFKSFNYFSS